METVPADTVIFVSQNDTMKNGILTGGKMKRKAGFTLAEVLITLGIIGIVASMTLPTLIQQNQKKVAATRLKQTYSQLYQAINMAQAEYGDMKNWNINENYNSSIGSDDGNQNRDMASKFAVTYLKPYLKYNGTPDIYRIKQLGYSDYHFKSGSTYSATQYVYLFELANGVSLFITYGSSSDVYTFPSIFVDINGKTKPNVIGRDLFLFDLDSVSKMKILPHCYGTKRETLLSSCSRTDKGYGNFCCTALIMEDGWEIKDDHPW